MAFVYIFCRCIIAACICIVSAQVKWTRWGDYIVVDKIPLIIGLGLQLPAKVCCCPSSCTAADGAYSCLFFFWWPI